MWRRSLPSVGFPARWAGSSAAWPGAGTDAFGPLVQHYIKARTGAASKPAPACLAKNNPPPWLPRCPVARWNPLESAEALLEARYRLSPRERTLGERRWYWYVNGLLPLIPHHAHSPSISPNGGSRCLVIAHFLRVPSWSVGLSWLAWAVCVHSRGSVTTTCAAMFNFDGPIKVSSPGASHFERLKLRCLELAFWHSGNVLARYDLLSLR